MADNIRLITWSGENVKPVNDANVYEAALGVGGVKYGCIVSASGANTLSVSAGNGVLCGRAFEIFDTTVQVQLSGSGTLQGRIYIHLDLSNTEEPIAIMTQTGNNVTPPVQQDNINVTNGIYEINLATFSVSPSAISNVVNVAPQLDLQAQIQAIADEATQKINALAAVARTGSFNDLFNKPTIDTSITFQSLNAVTSKAIYQALGKKADISKWMFAKPFSNVGSTVVFESALTSYEMLFLLYSGTLNTEGASGSVVASLYALGDASEYIVSGTRINKLSTGHEAIIYSATISRRGHTLTLNSDKRITIANNNGTISTSMAETSGYKIGVLYRGRTD